MGNVEAVQVLQELLAGKWRTWESPEVHARIDQVLEIACHALKPHPHPAYAVVDHAVKDSPNK